MVKATMKRWWKWLLGGVAGGLALVALERDKIKGAVRTDFILSAEIIAITLGIVADSPLTQQIIVLSGMFSFSCAIAIVVAEPMRGPLRIVSRPPNRICPTGCCWS